jgi:hypothetical protein
MNDGRFVVLDGLEKWSPKMIGEMRSVWRNQKTEPHGVLSGSRLCRVRQMCTLNPQEPMKSYAYKCQAIPDIKPFKENPDIARVDIWIPFSSDDVSEKDINERRMKERPVSKDLMLKLIKWTWTRNQFIYSDEAKEIIRKEATRIVETYHTPFLEIIDHGFRDSLCRLACSVAMSHFSTDDSLKVIIEGEHVREAVAFIERMCEALELKGFKKHVDVGISLEDSELGSILIDFFDTENFLRIVHLLALGQKTANELAEDLELDGGTIRKNYFPILEKHGLINTKRGSGTKATPKLIQLHRTLRVTELFVDLGSTKGV